MKKKDKREAFYFENLVSCVDFSEQAVQYLQEVLHGYKRSDLTEQMIRMHEIEHAADTKKHELTRAVAEDFITPIEREDLISLSNYLDDITDGIEEILRQLYIIDTDTIRSDLHQLVEVLQKAIFTVKMIMQLFADFKHSDRIQQMIVSVNQLEECGDTLYMDAMHKLYLEADLRTILGWKDIYLCVEACIDTCEHVADTVQAVIMKNS